MLCGDNVMRTLPHTSNMDICALLHVVNYVNRFVFDECFQDTAFCD